MTGEKILFLFDAPNSAALSFETIHRSNTDVFLVGAAVLLIVAWFGRKDARVWLAPLFCLASFAVFQAEAYFDTANRFDKIEVFSAGVQLDSQRDNAVRRRISFGQIDRVAYARTDRDRSTCRIKIDLRSGETIYSVNFHHKEQSDCQRIRDSIASAGGKRRT